VFEEEDCESALKKKGSRRLSTGKHTNMNPDINYHLNSRPLMTQNIFDDSVDSLQVSLWRTASTKRFSMSYICQSGQTSDGAFSAVSKPNFASKYSLEVGISYLFEKKPNTRWKALNEIYQIYIPLHLSGLKKSAIFRRNFW
jgi:hypothetical protein